jgi:hypothetical protein
MPSLLLGLRPGLVLRLCLVPLLSLHQLLPGLVVLLGNRRREDGWARRLRAQRVMVSNRTEIE